VRKNRPYGIFRGKTSEGFYIGGVRRTRRAPARISGKELENIRPNRFCRKSHGEPSA
jgi:hypothetical protein